MNELGHDARWRRLDTRMLLVHPVTELIRFLPFLIGLFVIGTRQSGDPWHYLGVAVPILLGLLRFLTTRFRITGTQIELRHGLIGRRVLTAPLDRVRTVELTARPIHRVLGLSRVEVGTASAVRGKESRLVLDALASAEARRLRSDLLQRAPVAADLTTGPAADPLPGPAAAEQVLLRLDPRWVRYAPLTTSGLVIAIGAVAASGQFIGPAISAGVGATHLDQRLRDVPLLVTIPAGLLTFAIAISVLASGGYLLSNWGFMLSRDPLAFHVRRGALTTRETSIDVDRLRGVEVHEPLGLRFAGAGRLTGIVTGVHRRDRGSSALVPPAPAYVVLGVADQLTSDAGAWREQLRRHGPAARRRRLLRGVVPLALVPALLGLFTWSGQTPTWLLVAALPLPVAGLALGLDRYARLGHALTPGHLVIRWGSLRGRRDVLERDSVIGWNLRQSWFQRRAGLVTLTATTGAGQQGYDVVDLPEQTAVELADAAVPGLISQFLA